MLLAFDIETEGLDSSIHRITVASVYDPDRNISHTFNFVRGDEASFHAEREGFLRCLDEAPALCCFNGVRFDIPFIAKRYVICLSLSLSLSLALSLSLSLCL